MFDNFIQAAVSIRQFVENYSLKYELCASIADAPKSSKRAKIIQAQSIRYSTIQVCFWSNETAT